MAFVLILKTWLKLGEYKPKGLAEKLNYLLKKADFKNELWS